MAYQVLAKGAHERVPEETWRGYTFQEARGKARWWLSRHGKPGEAIAEIWDEDSGSLCVTMRVDAHGLVQDDAGSDMDRMGVVWSHLQEVAGSVAPGRYDCDRGEYRFAVEGGYTVVVTREFLRETVDLPAALKSGVTLERIRNTGTGHTLVLTSERIATRPNQD